ncbi:MAG: family 78 glycoside hydrolase catalytic domain [bacterium]
MKKILTAVMMMCGYIYGAGVKAPEALSVEYLNNPVGLDCLAPRLSWKLVAKEASAKNLIQTAYHVEVVKTGVKGHEVVWDSGKVSSEHSLNVVYAGAPLVSSGRYAWRVRTWTSGDDMPSEWSVSATWVMGLLKAEDWSAKWIGANTVTRPDFDMAGAKWIYGANAQKQSFEKVFNAPAIPSGKVVLLALAGDETFDVRINGKEAVKTWGHLNSPKQMRFVEVTAFIKPGENKITAIVQSKKGEHAGFLATLRFPDGVSVVTDTSWAYVTKTADMDSTSYGKIERRIELVSPAFEKQFQIKKTLAEATLHITGVGFYEARLNGVRVGKKVLDPVPTKYDKRVLYSTYDLTGQLKVGDNALNVLLGHGWYDVRSVAVWNFDNAPWRNFPRMIAQLELVYADGTKELVCSDKSWRQVSSPVGFDCIREGEVIGLQRDKTVDLSKQVVNAEEVPGPAGKLVAEALPPSVIVQEIKPKTIRKVAEGVWGIDFGQNMAGWLRLQVKGQSAGDVLTIRYGERQATDGRVDIKPLDVHFRYPASSMLLPGGGFQVDRFVCDGSAQQVYEPRFTYNGFQYAEIRGLKRELTAEDVVACVVQTDFRSAGTFTCSNELINKMQDAIVWAYRSNFANGYPTDCPHREKNGWTGDAHLAVELAMYNFQNTAAYEKWIGDLMDEQQDNGNIAAIVPTSGWGYEWGNGPAWDSALVIIPWTLYVYQGNASLLEKAYPAMAKYVDYMGSKAKGFIASHGLSDWTPVQTKTPTEVTSTGYYYLDVQILAHAADALGKTEDAKKYAALAEQIKDAYNQKLYKGDGVYSIGSQTAQSCALHQGFVPAGERVNVEAKLAEVVEKNNAYPDFGILGSKYIFRALSEAGRSDLAFAMATKDDKKSFGTWIRRGATTFWEDWGDGDSRNHIMFGDVSAWWYQTLAGIRLADTVSAVALKNSPGEIAFKKIVIAPVPVAGLDWVKAEHDSPYGMIRSQWKKANGVFRLEFDVPVNTTATICLPVKPDAKGVTCADAAKTGPLRNRMTFTVGSGHYVAECPASELILR